MQRTGATRRRFLGATAATMVGLAGCSGGGEPSGESAGGDGSGGSGGGGEPTPTSTSEGGPGTSGQTASGGDATATANDSPDPNCSLLTGQPTAYDAAGTPFVFTFDYIDSWTFQEPLSGPGGRSHGLSSPVVSVDGESESAGIRIGQRFESLTAAETDEQVADATSGEYNPTEIVHEIEYDGETIPIVGFPDAELAVYRLWLPYDGTEKVYYPVEIDVLSSILRLDDENKQELLCLDAIQTATETIRTSLRPNPDTTIEDL